jgi:GTP cyclohydrolase II
LRVFRVEVRRDLIESVPVIWKGNFTDGMPVRINSACFTSETLGDRSCDCAWQLNAALELIEQERAGMIIYCYSHEGRGIGLFHKVNSMTLMQEQELTTAEAFVRLGVGVDERDFSFVADILRHFGLSKVRLMTNNPHKNRALIDGGIEILDEIRLVKRHDASLKRYLASKKEAFGHVIDLGFKRKQ